MIVSKFRKCPFCSEYNRVEFDYDAYRNWQNGELIQNAFPNLSANERELIKTGICPDCWGDEE